MEVAHVDIVKEKLGDETIAALKALYKSAKGTPPSVPAERFRADNHQWLDELDTLEHNRALIERSRTDCRNYILRSYALPLIKEAAPILDKMQWIYERMRELYPEHLSESITLSELLDGFEGEQSEWVDALYYLTQISGMYSGKSTDFPYDGGTMNISESVLRKGAVGDSLSQFYESHYVNSVRATSSWSFNSEENAQSVVSLANEQVVGFPDWYEELDEKTKSLIIEIEVALKGKLSVLPTIGLRTLMERVMVDKVGEVNGFSRLLNKFKEDGFTNSKEAELLASVLDAGNAAAHRAHKPNRDDLSACVEMVKHLLKGLYILQPKVNAVKNNTPQRN